MQFSKTPRILSDVSLNADASPATPARFDPTGVHRLTMDAYAVQLLGQPILLVASTVSQRRPNIHDTAFFPDALPRTAAVHVSG